MSPPKKKPPLSINPRIGTTSFISHETQLRLHAPSDGGLPWKIWPGWQWLKQPILSQRAVACAAPSHPPGAGMPLLRWRG